LSATDQIAGRKPFAGLNVTDFVKVPDVILILRACNVKLQHSIRPWEREQMA